MPNLHVIAAGSLLEFALGDVSSFPVGRVEQMVLHLMSFEEYLDAMDESVAIEYYHKLPLPNFVYGKLFQLFNEYIIIGGMPEIVASYKENSRSISALQNTYSAIWDNYTDDIEKYGKNDREKRILRHITTVAPSVRDRITFSGFGQSSFRSDEVSVAFRKLDKAGLIRQIYPSSDVSTPLTSTYKRKPKIQFLDTGLLIIQEKFKSKLLNYRT